MDVAPGLISDTKFSLDLSGFGQVQSFFPVRDGHRFVACTLSKLEAEIKKDGRKPDETLDNCIDSRERRDLI